MVRLSQLSTFLDLATMVASTHISSLSKNSTHAYCSKEQLGFILFPIALRFGGILLHSDRFKHINNVARLLLQETGFGQEVCVNVLSELRLIRMNELSGELDY